MICQKCGTENPLLKKCCQYCGAILQGYTINNVTGEYGYRNSDGVFSKTPRSSSKSSMYVDIDSNARVSLHSMTADEAMLLSLIIESGERDLLNSPLKYIGEQLYLYANKAYSQMYEESNKTLNIGDK